MKPVKMWAVFTPKGKVSEWTVRPYKYNAICQAEAEYQSSWGTLRREGYTCRRVTVTPDAGGE